MTSHDLESLLAAYDAETDKLPLGHENFSRGASSYNWRKAVTRELRELASKLSLTKGTAENGN